MEELVLTKKISGREDYFQNFTKRFHSLLYSVTSIGLFWRREEVFNCIRRIAALTVPLPRYVEILSEALFRSFGIAHIVCAFRESSREYSIFNAKWNDGISIKSVPSGLGVEEFISRKKIFIGNNEVTDLINTLPLSFSRCLPLTSFSFGVRLCFSGKPSGFILFSGKLSGKKWSDQEKKELQTLTQLALNGMEKAWLRHVVEKEKNKIQKMVLRYKQEVEKIVKTQGEYFAGLSHEMKAPLSIIKHHLMLADENGSEVNKEALYHQTQVLTQLVADVLLLVRLDGKAYTWNRSWIDLSVILKEIYQDFEIMAQEKGISFSNFADPNVIVFADKDKMKRMFINIITNALMYTPQGGVVEIYAKQSKIEARVAVLDTGIGLDKDDKNKVFTTFYRSRDARRVSGEGSGLGLAISKKIAEEHGGSIEIISEKNKGTAVVMRFPRC